ncbi:hypothetical protein EVAR_33067_1 [Eumeta japonica]|uniref:Uncharacterized protein n=1 Tax=Eumeta variegata TaxID=151549 RepID=A0A4C1WT97_EUMVA|nr:hypothetical protein EVAR_33067_1 [Eumeta japonica]
MKPRPWAGRRDINIGRAVIRAGRISAVRSRRVAGPTPDAYSSGCRSVGTSVTFKPEATGEFTIMCGSTNDFLSQIEVFAPCLVWHVKPSILEGYHHVRADVR